MNKIKYTYEEFVAEYYTDYIGEKYGDEWVDVVEKELLDKGIEVEWVYN